MMEITVAATLENLDKVQDFVSEILKSHGCPLNTITRIAVAVEEIYVNIAHYAYHPEVGKAIIRCCMHTDPMKVVIQFLDSGKPFDPLKKPDADISLSAEDRQIGGLGILMVKKIMDDVCYEYHDGFNILTIKKEF